MESGQASRLPLRLFRLLLLLTTVLSAIPVTGCLPGSQAPMRLGFNRNVPHVREGRFVDRHYDYRTQYKLSLDRLRMAVDPWLGTPYCMGGDGPRCVDCSGLVRAVFKKVNGAKLPRSSEKLFKLGRMVTRSKLAPGDLVFYKTGRKRISHVGIYMGANEFVHASSTAGVMITSMDDTYFKNHYMGARRIF